ncbi:unnamed protein product [Rotaria socialis]
MNTHVCLHFYIITFSSTVTPTSFEELSSEWHLIGNNLTQVRQVESRPIAPSPRSRLIQNVAQSIPRISIMKTTTTSTKISITPVWFEENKATVPIRYPPTITATLDEEVRRSFDIVAKYRAVRDVEHNRQVDFVDQPFIPSVNSTETLVVILDMLAKSMGMQTSFASKPLAHEESAYYASCGVATLATLPLLNTDGDGPLSTAIFNLNLDVSYTAVTSSENTLKEFVLSFTKDIVTVLECRPECVRVFELVHGSLKVQFGLTASNRKDTQNLAQKFQDQAKKHFPSSLHVLSMAKPGNYLPEWKSVLDHLRLHPDDFDPTHNRDYINIPAHDFVQQRGNRPYYRPIGWFRHALRVINKDNKNTVWLGMNNGPDEWCVAYHGTKYRNVRLILDEGLRGAMYNDGWKQVATNEVGEKANVMGTYLGTHCNKGSDNDRYAERFTVKMQSGSAVTEEHYRVVFQCRVKPKSFTEHKDPHRESFEDPLFKELRVYESDAIRLYGILLYSHHYLRIPNIPRDARWAQQCVIVAGGNGGGKYDNQLNCPGGISVDDDETIVITDYHNQRVMQWKKDATVGQVVAGGNGIGERLDQLNGPTDVLIDKRTNSLIISDRENRRVVRWSRQIGTTQGEILLENIRCHGLAMDEHRYLYVADRNKHEVRRYKTEEGDKTGTLVAGGNGKGDSLKQLDWPTHLFVDRQQTVYISDYNNHRVMKWNRNATEGIIVAGCLRGENGPTKLSSPRGLFVDTLGSIYVVERGDDRVTRWYNETRQSMTIVGGNGQGNEANRMSGPVGLSFDKHNNLYVVDTSNHRVQRFGCGK